MHRYTRILALMFVLSLFPRTPLLPQTLVAAHSAPLTAATATTAATPVPDDGMPLPRGCGSVTPAGDPEAACCLTGFVSIEGAEVAGAEVVISSAHGSDVRFTQVYSGTELRPFYDVNLAAAPLLVKTGDTITITARYSGHEQTVTHTVVAGSQQVDVVLRRSFATDYVMSQTVDLPNAPKSFDSPGGIAVDAREQVYVADTNNQRIQVFTNAGVFVREWGKYGSQPGQFILPWAIAVDPSFNVYVVDSGNKRIQKFDSQGHFLLEWRSRSIGSGQAEQPSKITIGPDGSIAVLVNTELQFFSSAGTWLHTWPITQNANDIAIDRDGYVYVTNWSEERIYIYSPAGNLILTWGEPGTQNGQFEYLSDVEVDSFGNIWVADKQRVQRFSASRVWQESRSTFSIGFSGALAIAQNGNLYLTAYDRVIKLARDAAIPQTWGSLSTYRQFSGLTATNDGNILLATEYPAQLTQFDRAGNKVKIWVSDPPFQSLTDIAKAPDGTIYLLDGDGHRVFKFKPDGTQLLTFGSSGSGPSEIVFAQGLAVDPHGDVYVADSWGDHILKYSSAGNFLFSWGATGSLPGQFQLPGDIAIDSHGFVYVADYRNNRIQQFDESSAFVSSWYRDFNSYAMNVKIDTIKIDAQDRLFTNDYYRNLFEVSSIGGGAFSSFGQNVSNTTAWDIQRNGNVYMADSSGKRIQIFRPMTYTRPIATIVAESATIIDRDQPLVMRGMGQDSDETPAIAAYRWTSDKDGIIGTGATLTVTNLSTGTHLITLEVQDSEGEWSKPITAEPIYFAPPPAVAWTMLLYLSGDYPDQSYNALNRSLLTLAGKNSSNSPGALQNPAVRVAALIDGPNNGDTRFVTIEPGVAGGPPRYQEFPRGELAMDNPATLSAFIAEGQQTFRAKHYYLAIADHGQGTTGIDWDATSDRADNGANGGLDFSAYLTVPELRQALAKDGLAPIDVLHLDACSMDTLELAYELRGSVGFLVAYQYVGWNSFNYYDYWSAMGENARPADVAKEVAQRYALFQRNLGRPYTVAALDLSVIDSVRNALDDLALSMASLITNDLSQQKAKIVAIRSVSRTFDDHDDDLLNQPASLYVDLADWAGRVRDAKLDSAVTAHAIKLLSALRDGAAPLVVPGSNSANSASMPASVAAGAPYIDLSGTNGVSIFYPIARDTPVFRSYVGNLLYQMTGESQWPYFLTADGFVLPVGLPFGPLPGPAAPVGTTPSTLYLPISRR